MSISKPTVGSTDIKDIFIILIGAAFYLMPLFIAIHFIAKYW